MQLRGRLPDSRLGLIIADFTIFSSRIHRFRTQGFWKSYRNFLSRSSFYLAGITGLFFRDGRVIGLFSLFCSLWVSLGGSGGLCCFVKGGSGWERGWERGSLGLLSLGVG